MSEGTESNDAAALAAFCNRIATNAPSAEDSEILKQFLITSGKPGTIQFGKYVVNIADGQDVRIGNHTYHGIQFDDLANAIRKAQGLIETDETDAALQRYFGALRDYSALFPYRIFRRFEEESGKTLDHVYIPLRARARNSQEGARTLQAQELLNVVETSGTRKKHLLIEAQAGAGKSTLLRQMALNAWDNPAALGLATPRLAIPIRLMNLIDTEGGSEDRLWTALTRAYDFNMDERPPSGFLRAWPARLKTSWLILADGFDEIPERGRASVQEWLQGALRRGEHSLVITSRPTDAILSSVRSYCNEFELLPMDATQQGQLAERWLGPKSSQFLGEVKHFLAPSLIATPLLLTIAATVYEVRGNLPRLRIVMYRQFLQDWLQEARERGIGGDLAAEPRAEDYIEEALSFLALRLSTGASTDNSGLIPLMRSFLSRSLGHEPAEAFVRRFLDLLGRRTGVFMYQGSNAEWIHPTFREYLAAERLSASSDDSTDILARWRDPNWRQIILFLLAIWSDNSDTALYVPERSQTALAKIKLQDAPWGLIFVGNALAEGAALDPEATDEVISELCEKANRSSRRHVCVRLMESISEGDREKDIVQTLALLSNIPSVRPRVDSLIAAMFNNARAFGKYGSVAMRDLAALGRTEELLIVARDETLPAESRYDAADQLIESGFRSDLAPALVELLPGARGRAIEGVKGANEWLSPIDLLCRILLSLEALGRGEFLSTYLRDADLPTTVRGALLGTLGKKKRDTELLEMAHDDGVDLPLRIEAYTELVKLGTHEHIPELTALLEKSDQSQEQDVRAAVQAIASKPDQLIDLLHQSRNATLRRVALSLASNPWWFDDLKQLATDQELSVEERLELTREWHSRLLIPPPPRITSLERTSTEEEDKAVDEAAERSRLARVEVAAGLLDRLLGEAIEQQPAEAKFLLERAEHRAAQNQCEPAILDFTLYLIKRRDDETALGLRGNLYRILEDYGSALADFDRALALDPDDAWDLARRGLVHRELDRPAAALKDFDRAIELASGEQWIYKYRASALNSLGRYEEAVSVADHALSLEESEAMPLGVKTDALIWLGRCDEAIKTADRALQLDPHYDWCLRRRIECHFINGSFMEAQRLLQETEALSPGTAGQLWFEIELLIRLGEQDRAHLHLEERRQKHPDEPFYSYLDGLMEYREGRKAKAEPCFAEALRKAEKIVAEGRRQSRFDGPNRALFLFSCGRPIEARAEYETLLSDDAYLGHFRRYVMAELELYCFATEDATATDVLNSIKHRCYPERPAGGASV